jgi:hypothetical protein
MIELQSGRAHPAARGDIIGLMRVLDAQPPTGIAGEFPSPRGPMYQFRPPAGFQGPLWGRL